MIDHVARKKAIVVIRAIILSDHFGGNFSQTTNEIFLKEPILNFQQKTLI